MSHIGKLIQRYQDEHGTSDRALALRIDVSPTLVGKWKHGKFSELPSSERMRALAAKIGASYEAVLDAFLLDVGYLEESDGDGTDAASMTTDELSEARRSLTGTDLSGLPSVAKRRKKRDNGE